MISNTRLDRNFQYRTVLLVALGVRASFDTANDGTQYTFMSECFIIGHWSSDLVHLLMFDEWEIGGSCFIPEGFVSFSKRILCYRRIIKHIIQKLYHCKEYYVLSWIRFRPVDPERLLRIRQANGSGLFTVFATAFFLSSKFLPFHLLLSTGITQVPNSLKAWSRERKFENFCRKIKKGGNFLSSLFCSYNLVNIYVGGRTETMNDQCMTEFL